MQGGRGLQAVDVPAGEYLSTRREILKFGLYDTEAQHRQLVTLLAENIGNDEAYKAAHPDSTRVKYAENTLSVASSASTSWLYSVDNGATTVCEGRTLLSRVRGVEHLGFADGIAFYRLPSGRYELTAALD